MIDTPQVVQTTARHTACIHLTVPRGEMMHVFGPAIQELVAVLSAQGMPPTEAAFAHHFSITPDTFDFEVGFPTARPVTAVGRVTAGEWPAMKAARTVYHGPYEGLPSAWGEFEKWMKQERLSTADDLWEHYVVGPQSSPDSSTWNTELTRPLTG
ncbi:MAG: GyrI-like domain-containing protein [Gemmatimonadaceae bacterium]